MSSSRVVFFLLGFILLLAVLIALLPSIASTDWGTRQTAALINRKIPGQVEINKMHLQWGSGQTIEGFTLKDPEGRVIAAFDRLQTEATLWQLLSKSTRLGHTKLENLSAQVKTDDRGVSNLQSALGLDAENQAIVILPSTIALSNVEADLNLFKGKDPLSLYLKGNTQEGELAGSFEVAAILPGLQLEEWSHLGQDTQRLLTIEGGKEAVLQARVKDFPVNLIDRLIALKKPEWNGIFHSLFGEKINIALDKESSVNGIAFNLTVLAPLMQANIKGKAVDQQIVLQAPAVIHLDLQPEFINPLIAKHFEIIDRTQLEVTLEELSLPFAFIESRHPVDPCLFSFLGSSQLQTPAKVRVFPLGDVEISNLQASFGSASCQDTVQIQVTGQAQQQGQEPFNLNFDSSLGKPVHLKDFIRKLREEFQGTLKISHFPLQWPSLPPMQRAQLELLGNRLDASLTFRQTHAEGCLLALSLKTDTIKLPQAHFKVGDHIQLTHPLSIEYLVQPASVKPFLTPYGVELAQSTLLEMGIQKFNISLSSLEKGQFTFQTAIKSLGLNHELFSHPIEIQNVLLNIEGRSLSEIHAQFAMKLGLPASAAYLSSVIGDQAQIKAASHITIDPEGLLTFSHLETNIQTPQASLHLAGRLLPNYQLILMHPLEINYKLTPNVFKQMTPLAKEGFPKLHNNPHLYFKADPFQINLRNIDLSSLVVNGSFSIDRLMLQDTGGALTTLEQIEMPWELNGPTNTAFLTLKGQAFSHFQHKPSQLSIQIDFANWHFQNAYAPNHLKVEVDSQLTALPTALISPFVGTEDLSPLIGSALDIDLKTLIDPEQKSPGYWDMKLDSTLLHAQARLKFEQAIILYESTNKFKPAAFRLTMTPEGYECLLRLLGKQMEKETALAAPFDIKGGFTDFYLPLNKMTPVLNDGRVKAQLETTEITLKDSTPIAFRASAQVASQNLKDQIQFESQLIAAKGDSHLSFKGTVSHLFDSQNQARLDQAVLKLEAHARHLPLAAVQSLFLLDSTSQKQLEALIGKEINAEAKIALNQMNGLIRFDLQSSHSRALLDGEIRQGLLTLQQPLEWEVLMTPQLSQAFFSDRFPIFSHAIAAEKPLKLTIEPQGFELPIYPLDLRRLSLAQGSIDLGKIYFKNEGELRSVINLLKPIPEDQITIWFTPLYFQIMEEQLQLKRLDMLVANRYSLASWGKVGLDPKQKVDMVLGLSAQALQYAFDIEGLEPGYMLQIPVRGKKGNVELDKATAAARISALLAQLQGDAQTKILGSVLELATGGFQDPQPPAPTTMPLPWQQEFVNRSAAEEEPVDASQQQTKKDKERGKKIWKEVEKEAAGLMRSLLQPKS